VCEDSTSASFAGVFESYLGVDSVDDALTTIVGVWISSWSPRTIRYARHHGIEVPLDAMAMLSSTRSSTEVRMRYRVMVSRVQVAERHVRAVNEEEALKKIQTELEQPYGFLGGWKTTSTDIDVAEVAVPLHQVPRQVGDDGKVLLSLKEAAKHLGVSYGALYELVNTAEIQHVAIGRRKYISRDALKSFIDAHTRLGWQVR
jgi:excisionase family DNA binding protein